MSDMNMQSKKSKILIMGQQNDLFNMCDEINTDVQCVFDSSHISHSK